MSLIYQVQFVAFLLCYGDIFAYIVPVIPATLSLHRYEGNYYPTFASKNVQSYIAQGLPEQGIVTTYLNPVQLSHQIYHHSDDETPFDATPSDYQVQPLQQVSSSGKHIESGASQATDRKLPAMLPKERRTIDKQNDSVTRHYHDIFLKLKTPKDLVFGHVLNWPEVAEKKFEKRQGNNYKGQVIWADRKGGYGEHYWDLAQGAL